LTNSIFIKKQLLNSFCALFISEYTRATMGAPFKQTQQLSKIGNGVSDCLSFSDNEHGHQKKEAFSAKNPLRWL
jgi:hypothetical protein